MTPEQIKQLAADEKKKCEELEDLAFNGAELPKNISFPHQLLFLKFRYLYLYAKLAQMPPEQGKREKQEILNSYLIDRVNDGIYQASAQLWKNVEAASASIRKDIELMENEKVRALLTAIYGADIRKGGYQE